MIIAGYGIDVSHHQGKIDWSKVARSGITSAGNLPANFAILKCIYEAQSHRPDERFEDNYRGCIDNAINVGIYVYHASASLADPVAEAEALVRTLNGRKLHLGIWHDLEDKSLRIAGNVDLDIDFTGLAAAMAKELPKSADGYTPSKQGLKTVKVTNKLNIRLSPELGDNIIDQLPNGAKVNVTEISGKWAKIEGWVSTNYLT